MNQMNLAEAITPIVKSPGMFQIQYLDTSGEVKVKCLFVKA